MSFKPRNPIPVVGVAPDSAPVTCIAVNTSWVEILVGLCEAALWPGFWSGTSEEVDQAVSHVIQLASMMVGGECVAVQYAKLFQSSSGPGGSAVIGWQTRILSHLTDPDSIVSLSSNLFTPIAGTYIVRAYAPHFGIGFSHLRLYDETQERAALKGIPDYSRFLAATYTAGRVFLCGLITADGETEFSLQHYCEYALGTYGLGLDAGSGEDNQYGTVELTRIS